MTPGRIFFLGLLVVAGALFLLNPGEEQFREFLSDEIAERAGGGRSGVAGFLAERLGRAAGGVAVDFFQRDDYYLWSVYTADMNGRAPDGEWVFLGIANTFLALDQPADDE